MTVWGNHSPTMYADYRFANVNGESLKDKINDAAWNKDVFLPTVGKRVLRLSKHVVCLLLLLLQTLQSTICAIGLLAQTANG